MNPSEGELDAEEDHLPETGVEAYERDEFVASQNPATRRQRIKVLAPILAIATLFYTWTGATEKINPFATSDLGKQTDAYNLLTSAFLRGHLSIYGHAPSALTSLKDPYDPAQNGYWSGLYHDLALYKGHLFLTWGPTPVVTLLMPWRLLHVGMMPVRTGVIIYCCFGLLFSVALLTFLVDRYLPDTKLWQLALASVALALCNVAPFLLRRPDVYELAISSGYCFTMLGAYLLASGGLSPTTRKWRLGLGSLSLGLAVGGRPDLIVTGLLAVGILVYLLRKDRVRTPVEIFRWVMLVLGPFSAIFLLILAYNYARFGSPLQNGGVYALAGVNMRTLPVFRSEYLVPSLYYYLISPVHWTFAFPYVSLGPPPYYPGKVPSYYHLNEITGGLVTTTPIVLAAIPGIFLLRRRGKRELQMGLIVLLVVGALALLFLALALPSTTMRYAVDYATLFLIPGLIGWFVLMSGRGRRVIAVVGTVVIVYGCVVGAAISFTGYYDGLRTTHPDTYWTLDRLTSPLPTALTMILGHPVIARVFPADAITSGNGGTYGIEKAAFGLSTYQIEVDIISPRSGRWSLAPTFTRTADAGTGPLSLAIQADNGNVQSVPMGLGPTSVPLTLRRGLNRIKISATGRGFTYPNTTLLVAVNGLRLSSN